MQLANATISAASPLLAASRQNYEGLPEHAFPGPILCPIWDHLHPLRTLRPTTTIHDSLVTDD